MKKLSQIFLVIFSCYVAWIICYGILSFLSLDENIVVSISILFFLLPLITYIIAGLWRIKKQTKENEIVSKVSLKINYVNKQKKEYNFAQILKVKRNINEREYSRKSFDRTTAKDIIFYHFDNNTENILIDVKNAIENKKKQDELIIKVKGINMDTPEEIINKTNFSREKFKAIEDRVISKIIDDKSDYNIIFNVQVNYRSPKGQVNDLKCAKLNYNKIFEYYEEWSSGKAYNTIIKVERSIMNDNIRYNVLKRDNYKCKICGATAKDGAKLHVDHIIPVSRGGKTIMSNLQTLCERCNIGKSNKTEEDFDNNMICPKCGSKLVNRRGKYGKFIGCSNYPTCHYKK